jgi:hypothetical protein
MQQTIKLRCPNLLCRIILTVPAEMRGEVIRCASCNETLRVPSPRPVAPVNPDAASAGRGPR